MTGITEQATANGFFAKTVGILYWGDFSKDFSTIIKTILVPIEGLGARQIGEILFERTKIVRNWIKSRQNAGEYEFKIEE